MDDSYLSTYFSAFLKLSLFLSNEGGNKWIIMDFYGICKISPEDLPRQCYLSDKYARYLQRIYPSHAISETKKV